MTLLLWALYLACHLLGCESWSMAAVLHLIDILFCLGRCCGCCGSGGPSSGCLHVLCRVVGLSSPQASRRHRRRPVLEFRQRSVIGCCADQRSKPNRELSQHCYQQTVPALHQLISCCVVGPVLFVLLDLQAPSAKQGKSLFHSRLKKMSFGGKVWRSRCSESDQFRSPRLAFLLTVARVLNKTISMRVLAASFAERYG